jgi:hypothetical protein
MALFVASQKAYNIKGLKFTFCPEPLQKYQVNP